MQSNIDLYCLSVFSGIERGIFHNVRYAYGSSIINNKSYPKIKSNADYILIIVRKEPMTWFCLFESNTESDRLNSMDEPSGNFGTFKCL